MSRNLRISKEQLKALGESRETRQQQHLYLLDMASRFQKITDLALKAQYGGDDLFESISGLKLATAVVDRNEKFSEDIYQNGHKYRFKRGLNAQDGANTSKAIDEQPNTLSDTEFEVGKYETVNVRYFATHPGLDEVKLFEGLVTQPSNDDILVELERMYRYSRGLEIGTFDAQLVPIVWKAQSTKWKHISQGYISDMVTLVHVFIITLLSSVCADDRVRRSLMSNLMNELTLCYQKAINHARFILKVERDGTPMTLNHYFADNLEKRSITLHTSSCIYTDYRLAVKSASRHPLKPNHPITLTWEMSSRSPISKRPRLQATPNTLSRTSTISSNLTTKSRASASWTSSACRPPTTTSSLALIRPSGSSRRPL